MRFLVRSALKDLRRQLADPAALLLWFGIPVAIALMIVLAFGGRSTKAPVAELLIADLDSTIVSAFVVQGLDNVPVIAVETVSPDTGRERIDGGDGSAFLVLPDGFQEAVLNGTPLTLDLAVNPSQQILPSIIEETVSMLVDAVFYLQAAAGDSLDAFLAAENPGGGFDAAAIGAFAAGIGALVQKAESTLFPPVLTLEVETPPRDEQGPGIGVLFFPGILFLSLLFMGQGLAGDVWIEKDSGTLRRVLATPRGSWPLIGGKILSGAILAGAVSAVAMAFGRWWFDLAWERLLAGLAWSVFSGTVFLSLLILIQLSASTQKGGNLLTSFLMFPLLMLGGSFFPFEAMPDWMAAIGRWTPNGRALVGLRDLLLGRADAAALLATAAGLGALGLGAFLISGRRLRRFAAGA